MYETDYFEGYSDPSLYQPQFAYVAADTYRPVYPEQITEGQMYRNEKSDGYESQRSLHRDRDRYDNGSHYYGYAGRHDTRYHPYSRAVTKATGNALVRSSGAVNRTYYDPLATLRPGALATEYVPEKKSREENEKAAHEFLYNEVDKLGGDVHIIFESVRKFGRFDYRDGRMVLQDGETEASLYESLARLWQIGDGYIYLRQTDQRRANMFVYVFHIDHNTYTKLDPKQAAEMISHDPFWKKLGGASEFHFL